MNNIDDMIAVLEAAKRGEPIEQHLKGSVIWESKAGDWWNFAGFDYRIAPKKEMGLVERLRYQGEISGGEWGMTMKQAADHITALEGELMIKRSPDVWTTDELLAELKRRCDV